MNAAEKIVLGTVQFGLDYGVNNHTGQIQPEEVQSILSLANTVGIKFLDTSSAYGESESVIGKSLHQYPLDFSIISKYPKGNLTASQSFQTTLSRLKKEQLYGYLIHHFDHFLEKPEIWQDLLALKEMGVVSKIGFSLYHPIQLEELFERGVEFNLVQFPFNLFDRQFEPYFNLLKKSNVEIHTRSVFLQGLFFKEISAIKGKLNPLRPYLTSLQEYCLQRSIKIEELALNYAVNNPYINGVLIGVDNYLQLQKNIEALTKGITPMDIDFIESLKIEEKELLNPVNWN